MPRIARLVVPGMPHHVTQRGNRRGTVFFADSDRLAYLALLRECTSRLAVDVLAYCLMNNHVHLVVVPPAADALHRALKPLHMQHAQRINRTHDWKGHVWQGRYFSSPLDETYLWAAIRYVELNPVRAGLVRRAEHYPWSSAAGHCGVNHDAVITTDGSWTRRCRAIGDWAKWLASGDERDYIDVLRRRADRGLPCGSAEFVAELEQATGRDLTERPRGRHADAAGRLNGRSGKG